MAKFVAAGIVEPLEYDFTDLKDVRGLEDVQGVIPEPSAAQVRAFNLAARAEIRRLAAEITETSGDTADLPAVAGLAGVLDILSAQSASLSSEAIRRQAQMLSALCSGHPTVTQLEKLPWRIMSEFAKWLTGEVMSPEAVTGGGDARVLSLASPAAG